MFDTFSNLFLYFKTILSTVLIVSSFFALLMDIYIIYLYLYLYLLI